MRTIIATVILILVATIALAQEQKVVLDSVQLWAPVSIDRLENEQLEDKKRKDEGKFDKNEELDVSGKFFDVMPTDVYRQYNEATNKSALGEALLEAYERDLGNIEVLDELMSYYEIIGDDASIKKVALNMESSGKYHQEIYSYQDNIIASLSSGSILITNGEWDTYPMLGRLSLSKGDLVIVNIQLLEDDLYRSTRLTQKGLIVPGGEYRGPIEFIQRIYGLNPRKELHLGMTVDKAVLRALRSQLHIAGLTFKYGMEVSSAEVERVWRKQTDQSSFGQSNGNEALDDLNMNYLPMLSVVRRHYLNKGNTTEAAKIEKRIELICTKAGEHELIKQLLRR